jgi:hypothetical protein
MKTRGAAIATVACSLSLLATPIMARGGGGGGAFHGGGGSENGFHGGAVAEGFMVAGVSRPIAAADIMVAAKFGVTAAMAEGVADTAVASTTGEPAWV